MAIRKTGSRRLVVDGQPYLWRVRHKPSYCQANCWGGMAVSAQHAGRPGAVLVADLDLPRPDNWLGQSSRAVGPAEVAGLIRQAIADGWVPHRPGKQFLLPPNRSG